jgi:hypothetical protein
MQRPTEEIRDTSALHDKAGVHHNYLIAEAGCQCKVVRDEENSHAKSPAEIIQKVQHLRLNGHVKGSRGFIGDEQVWLESYRHCNQHPLFHATTQLVRVGSHAFGRGRNPD